MTVVERKGEDGKSTYSREYIDTDTLMAEAKAKFE